MALTLWLFWTYSFLGYLLEKAFAWLTRSPQQVRKCFLLLPLCPVYGLGVLAVLALPPELRRGFWNLAVWGGLAATAVEYGVHWAYERLFGVRFWDYHALRGNLRGRVCVPFSIAWGLLLAVALPGLQQILVPPLSDIPAWVSYLMLLLFTADGVISARILDVTRDIDQLRLLPAA